MENSFLKRFAIRATVAALIGTQLTGCLTVPNQHGGLNGVLQNAEQLLAAATQAQNAANSNNKAQVANSVLGALQQATQPQQTSAPTQGIPVSVLGNLGGVSPIGNPNARYTDLRYTSADFQHVYSRFKAAKAVAVAKPNTMSKVEFLTLTGAVTDLMRYIDAIEAHRERLGASGVRQPQDWDAFYAEAMAASQPGVSMPLATTASSLSMADASQMLAYEVVTIPGANLPKIGSGGSVQPPPIAMPVFRQPVPQQNENEMRDAVVEDIKDFGMIMGFNEFLSRDTSTMTGLLNQFRSRKAQAILTATPVVGNLINAGMIFFGRNLDGDPMDSYDYAAASLGLIPVAGNIASKLGSGARVLATELRAASAALKNNPQIELSLELLGSESAELAYETAQPWLKEAVDAVTAKVVAGLPQTSTYAQRNNIKL